MYIIIINNHLHVYAMDSLGYSHTYTYVCVCGCVLVCTTYSHITHPRTMYVGV